MEKRNKTFMAERFSRTRLGRMAVCGSRGKCKKPTRIAYDRLNARFDDGNLTSTTSGCVTAGTFREVTYWDAQIFCLINPSSYVQNECYENPHLSANGVESFLLFPTRIQTVRLLCLQLSVCISSRTKGFYLNYYVTLGVSQNYSGATNHEGRTYGFYFVRMYTMNFFAYFMHFLKTWAN